MSFNLTQNKTNTTNTTVTNNNLIDFASFPKIMEDINKSWNEIMGKLKIVREDINHLERMFHNYPNEYCNHFFQLKELLKQYEENLKNKLLIMEQEVFNMKARFNQ